ARALRLHVVASREEAALYGLRVRPAARVGARVEPRVARHADGPAPRGRAEMAGRSQPRAARAAGPAPEGLRQRRLPLGAARRLGAERALVPAPGRGKRAADPRRLQLHAGAALQLPPRRAARRLLARAPEQRLAALRR